MKLLKLLEEIENINADVNVIEFPNDNYSVSFFDEDKSILFTPQQHNSITARIRKLINSLKQQFKISRIESKELNAFQIYFDPVVDFNSVKDFVTQEAEINAV